MTNFIAAALQFDGEGEGEGRQAGMGPWNSFEADAHHHRLLSRGLPPSLTHTLRTLSPSPTRALPGGRGGGQASAGTVLPASAHKDDDHTCITHQPPSSTCTHKTKPSLVSTGMVVASSSPALPPASLNTNRMRQQIHSGQEFVRLAARGGQLNSAWPAGQINKCDLRHGTAQGAHLPSRPPFRSPGRNSKRL